MWLKLEDGSAIKNPDAIQIEEALRGLVYYSDNSFAVLKKNSRLFMRVAQEEDMGELMFVLEYQDASEGGITMGLSLDQVIEACQKFAFGDDTWREDFNWEERDMN